MMKITNPMFKTLLTLTSLLLGMFFLMTTSQAQEIIKPEHPGTTNTVKPDNRRCAFPMCGGWFITPVNQYSLALETEDEAYQNASLLPNSTYVAYINYKRLGLTEKQIAELEANMHAGQALLRGTVVKTPSTDRISTNTLVTNGAWVGANKTVALGPYLNISSSGIVCITTPCPYYNAGLINSGYVFPFHELTFAKAELNREQEAQAWQAVATGGLVMTGVRFVSQGMTGTGTGISATKVFFAFPPKP
jgi:hypothetical protein